MLELPVNDFGYLEAVSEVVAELVARRDVVIAELARNHRTLDSVVAWIQGMPLRDSAFAARTPPHRLRIPALDPTGIERAALYLAIAEVLDPSRTRQLARVDTQLGLHTCVVEAGVPIVLDPRIARDALARRLATLTRTHVAIEAREAIELTSRMAEAGAAHVHNGPLRVRTARNAIADLVLGGVAPADLREHYDIGWMLARAASTAARRGWRARAMVRVTERLLANAMALEVGLDERAAA